jgi:Aldos-2-ulose dehydratase, beta-propeller domain/FG-GAP-like repeat
MHPRKMKNPIRSLIADAHPILRTKAIRGIAVILCGGVLTAKAAEGRFRAVEIDHAIEIGYGLAVTDVDGDGKPDIVLADKKQIVWYRNPKWEKFVIAENLTKLDNVCVAAADIDGDGKAEIAVGAEWNPNDTINSGAVFYLIAPKDRTQKWEAVELPHEPTVHRMRWVRDSDSKFKLVVVPLHGRGNKNGEGAGVRILSYKVPANPKEEWKTELMNDSMHMTHNFDPIRWTQSGAAELLVAGKEGVFDFVQSGKDWSSRQLIGKAASDSTFAGCGEVRVGKGKFAKATDRFPNNFIATIEPMHGNQVAVYVAPSVDAASGLWNRKVIDSSLKEGHALACGDLLGVGSDQIVAGWRVKNAAGKVGIKLYWSEDSAGKEWRETLVDDDTMACEDLCLADLDGDGKLDIVAAGRATKNVKIYFNNR